MTNPIELVKAHPVVTGVSVLAVLAVGFFVLNAGGGGAAGSSGPMVALPGQASSQGANDAIAAGVQLQALRTQAQLTNDKTAAEERVAMAKIGADATATKYNYLLGNQKIASDQYLTALKTHSDTTISTLTLAANKAIALANNDAAIRAATLGYQASVYASKVDLAKTQIAARTHQADLNTAIAQTALNKDTSIWGAIFGN